MTDSPTAKEYGAAFNKALRGMSYNDFQQTVLLPQNGFTRFIKASNKERVDLLERITGTGHLAELCLQAQVKHKEFRKELQEERDKLIGVMNETEVLTARQTLERYNRELKAYGFSQTILRLGEEWEHHRGLLETRRQTYQDKEKRLVQIENNILQQEKDVDSLQTEGTAIKKDLERLQSIRPTIEEDLRQVSDELNHLEMKKSHLGKIKIQMDKQSKEVDKVERQLKKVTGVSTEELAELHREQQNALTELINRVGDASLSDYGAQVSRRQRFLRRQSEWCRTFLGHWEAKLTLEKSIAEIESELASHEQETIQNTKQLKQHEEACTKIEGELTAVRKRLEKAQSFFVFHDERVKLEEGEKCALCGSTTHPFKRMADPDKYNKAVEAQKQIEQQRTRFERQVQDERAKVTSLRTSNNYIHRQQENNRKKLTRMQANLDKKQQDMNQITIDLGREPGHFVKEDADTHRRTLDSQCEQLDSLSQRLNRSSAKLNTMLQSQNKHQELINQKHALLLKQDELGDQCTQLSREMTESADQLSSSIGNIANRVNLITKSQCALPQKLASSVGFLQRHLQSTWMKWSGLLNDWQQRETRFQERLNHHRDLKQNLLTELDSFRSAEAALKQTMLDTQHKLTHGLLSMEKLSIQWFDMDAEWIEQWTALKEARRDIMMAKAKVEQSKIGIEARLKQYEENLERMRRIQQLENLVQQWKDMHTLLNTTGHVVADPTVGRGLTFRTYAQIRQLQLLVRSANEHLSAMQTDYLLEVRKDADGRPVLDFEVKMESDCSRPLTTLSGGQTFLVSLAFALALSDLRKVNFSIETLLIDEGFGALDRNYVEMAVDTLDLLKHRGVQVGLISHVVALQEKIATAVTIEELKFIELDAERVVETDAAT